jgi:anti-sigma factor RsiW
MTDDDDADLVTLIDDELDEDRKKVLLARLETDERLRERYEALRETGAPIAASFEALLRQAPIARLRAGLPADGSAPAPSRRFAGIALRELAAGIAIGLLMAGLAAWVALSLAPIKGKEDWRSAVVD